jgi:predicted transcriptional regulator
MERDAMMRYVEPDSLLIIGNREREQYAALEQGAAVLITGGFQTGENVKQLADKLSLPIISSSYDTFTVASLINRAIYDRLIKKKIILVEDIISPETQVYALRGNQTVEHWKQLMETTGYTRFPVVDEWNRVTGIITTKDIVGAKTDQTIDKLMTRGPNTVTFTTSVASAAHTMVWEGIELLPVIDNKGKLVTVISRKDVLKSLQYVQKQPQNGETFEDLIVSALEETKNEQGQFILKCVISPQMTNHLGTVSEGVLTTLITQSAYRTVKEVKKVNLVLENMTTYFLRPVQIDSQIEIHPGIIEVSRKFSKVEVGVYYQGNLVAKAILSAQVMD